MTLSRSELFDAIRLARPLLILFVCLAHIPGIEGYQSDYYRYDQITTLWPIFILDYLTRAAVPILTVFSGYLAYASFKKRRYGQIVADKTKRLLVPFLFWNAVALLVCWLGYKVTGFNMAQIADVNSGYAVLSKLIGLDLQLPVNAPTYFIRDLFVIMLLLPVIHWVCSNAYATVIVLGMYLVLLWFIPGIAYFGEAFSAHILFRQDMIVFFVLGYYIARHGLPIPSASGYTICVCTTLMIVIGVLISMYLAAFKPDMMGFMRVRFFCSLLFVLTAPALLCLLLKLKGYALGRLLSFLSPYSFTLFLSHILTGQVLYFIAHHFAGLQISEASSFWAIGLFALLYCLVISIGAIVLLEIWRARYRLLSRS